MSSDWWGVAWVACGLPFAIVCTAQIHREDRSWLGLLPGISIAFMFGPISLLMIQREHEDEATGE